MTITENRYVLKIIKDFEAVIGKDGDGGLRSFEKGTQIILPEEEAKVLIRAGAAILIGNKSKLKETAVRKAIEVR